MKKFVFVAFFAVCFIGLASVSNPINGLIENESDLISFTQLETNHNHADDVFCQCNCSATVWLFGREVVLHTYVNNAQTCSDITNGSGSFDSGDCKSGAGMLNAQSVEEFKAAESGGGC